MTVITVKYDGKYPNLCTEALIITINGKAWLFPEHCLRSGGGVFINDGEDLTIKGKWTIDKWPHGFPEDLRTKTIDAINKEIPLGCCGGCI